MWTLFGSYGSFQNSANVACLYLQARLRFEEESSAVEALEKAKEAGEGTVKLGEIELQGRVLEGNNTSIFGLRETVQIPGYSRQTKDSSVLIGFATMISSVGSQIQSQLW